MECFINGRWTPAKTGRRAAVTNPSTGEIIDHVPLGDAADADSAVQSAHAAFKKWRTRPMEDRARLQQALAAALREHREAIAGTLTLELGRPLAGAFKEVDRVANLLHFFAEEGLRMRGEVPLLNLPNERVLVVREPVGVVVAITPFNYPLSSLTFKLGAALIAGCTVVSKPSMDTPLSTLMMAEVFYKAGLPKGVFNVVTGSGSEVGEALVEHPVPRKVSFTGGTFAGKRIAASAAQSNKRVTLELGGQTPAIICEDADLDVAIPGILGQTFNNAGQFCYRVNRIYVQRNIYQPFSEHFAQGARQIVVSDGMDPSCQIGPLVNQEGLLKSEEHVRDALSRGARLLTGGKRLTDPPFDRGNFFPPTVLGDTDHSMKIMTEETFGPVVGIMPFDHLDQAVDLANDTPYGLAAYIFSKDLATAWKTAERCEAGSVWVNQIHRSYNQVPFGGYKESGLGREKSHFGLEHYFELKTIYLSL
jgi:succinate-semialdehyde dehydrogenase / glutarate-semialdehyde dehydrogenase